MKKSPPYKQALLGLILDFCYPEDPNSHTFQQAKNPESFKQHIVGSKYPEAATLRNAIIDLLQAHIGRTKSKGTDSVGVLKRALNQPVNLTNALSFRTPVQSMTLAIVHTPESAGRSAAQRLLDYFEQDGPFFGVLCQRCSKVFIPPKANQRFCTDQCRWDFWNDRKMEGYYKEKTKSSREHKRRIKARKKGAK